MKPVTCAFCEGDGIVSYAGQDPTKVHKCPFCGGSGKIDDLSTIWKLLENKEPGVPGLTRYYVFISLMEDDHENPRVNKEALDSLLDDLCDFYCPDGVDKMVAEVEKLVDPDFWKFNLPDGTPTREYIKTWAKEHSRDYVPPPPLEGDLPF